MAGPPNGSNKPRQANTPGTNGATKNSSQIVTPPVVPAQKAPKPTSARASKRTARPKKTRGYTAYLLDKAAKLTVWYSLITVLLRCPSTPSELTADSPRVCKPYFQARDYLTPHVQPYYNTYAAPYVEKVQPYVQQAYIPARAAYDTHAAPRVAQAQVYGQQQWQETVKPQLAVAREQAGKQYEANLAPHVKKVTDVIEPHYSGLASSVSDIWELEVQPVYRNTFPYAQKLFTQGKTFAVQTALPQAQYASAAAWTLWVGKVWPSLRVLYGENVEPQLLRITERLGRYKDGKKLEASIKSAETSLSLDSGASTATSIASSVSSAAASVTDAASSAILGSTKSSSVTASSTPEPIVSPSEQFKTDLANFFSLSSLALEEGNDHLATHLTSIATAQTKAQVNGTGSALLTQLEQTALGSINSVKARILSIVASIPVAEGAKMETKYKAVAEEALATAIRNAGQSVKSSAQSVRDWKAGYTTELDHLVAKAKEGTLDTLEEIRSLRISELGRRYTNTDLPHSSWAEYSKVKKEVSWRESIESVIKDNKDIAYAKSEGERIESEAMAVAEDAAKELGRLKKVGQWKIAAGDATDDFNTKHTPAVAEGVKQQVVGAAGAVAGSASKAKDSVADAASAASENVVGTQSGVSDSATDAASSVSSAASDKSSSLSSAATDAASSVSSAVAGTPSALSSSATDAVNSVSSAIIGTPSALTDSATDAASSLSSAVIGTPSGLSDSATDSASSLSSVVAESSSAYSDSVVSAADSVSSAASSASEKVIGSSSGLIDSATDLTSSASSAVVGSPSGLSDSATDAASSVSSVVVGTPSSLTDSATDLASSASSVILGSGTSLASSASSYASSLNPSEASVLVAGRHPADPSSSSASVEAAEPTQKKVWGGAMAQVIVEPREPLLDEEIVDDDSDVGSASAVYESAVSAASSALFGAASEASVSVGDGSEGASGAYESAVTA